MKNYCDAVKVVWVQYANMSQINYKYLKRHLKQLQSGFKHRMAH